MLAVYTGSSVDGLTTIAANDDDPALWCCERSFVGFEAVAGTVYKIAVGGSEWWEGDFALSWSPLILGTAGADNIVGTSGVEEIRSLGGNDVIQGLGGADVLVGGYGNDRGLDGSGTDVLFDLRGRDILAGGAGSDSLNARDFIGGDLVDGGTGQDACNADPRDVRRRCP